MARLHSQAFAQTWYCDKKLIDVWPAHSSVTDPCSFNELTGGTAIVNGHGRWREDALRPNQKTQIIDTSSSGLHLGEERVTMFIYLRAGLPVEETPSC
ncbi:hypothetical protein HaLaN_32297, partial [Haematococcus lacustris]